MLMHDHPSGSPAVSFSGPITFTQVEVADACRLYGPHLRTPGLIDGARLLWALAGQESGFGANCQPLHHAAYCNGKHSESLTISTLKFGHAAHCSFGPWQLLWANTSQMHGADDLFGTLNACASITVNFLNRQIIGRQHAGTVEQVADAYSRGNCREGDKATDYVANVLRFYYDVSLPTALVPTVQGAEDAVNRDQSDRMDDLDPRFGFRSLLNAPVDAGFSSNTYRDFQMSHQ